MEQLEYYDTQFLTFKSYVNKKEIRTPKIFENRNAVHLLERWIYDNFQNEDMKTNIDKNSKEKQKFKSEFIFLSKNANATHVIKEHIDKCNFLMLLNHPEVLNIFGDTLNDKIAEEEQKDTNNNNNDQRNKLLIKWLCGNEKLLSIVVNRFLSYNNPYTEFAIHQLADKPYAINIIEGSLRMFLLYERSNFWEKLCQNSGAIHIIEEYMDKLPFINWKGMCLNENAKILSMIERNLYRLDLLCWSNLCKNLNAIHILEKNEDKIVWNILCKNVNAIKILEQNIDKLDEHCWSILCVNPQAINIIEKNLDKLSEKNWNDLYRNPNIFMYDYEKISKNKEDTNKELIEYYNHPERLFR